jgi:hypothetical protein
LYDKHIACGQSRAKKKEIIADNKIAKEELLKQIHLWNTKKAYGYVIFLTWVRVGLSLEGRLEMEPYTSKQVGLRSYRN